MKLPQTSRMYQDAKRTRNGLRAMREYGRTADDFNFGISLFAAGSLHARVGQPSHWRIELANAARQHRWVRLLLDIYLKDHPVHPDGHYAYFEKKVFVPARAQQPVVVRYDWQQAPELVIDGVALGPDDYWRGDCAAAGAYLVKAVLLSDAGKAFDEYALVQRLQV
jgi:hypothetical protein